MAAPIDNQSRVVAFVSIFTAIAVVLDSIPIIPGFYSGVWDSWLFLISPLYGIILGPVVGATSIAMGSFIGHLVYFRDPFELLFMFGTPLGAGISGLVFQKRWSPVLAIYSFLLAGYFITPVSWQLPMWGVWDILVGFGILLIFSFISSMKIWKRTWKQEHVLGLLFAIVIGLETDVLFRVFVLVPGQTYRFFYGLTIEALQAIWWGAGFITPLKVIMSVTVGLMVGNSLLRLLPSEMISEDY
ncbi:hypothetical protein EU527_03015 [Candidatus Thorarchaeota archaeon]|nr:MAG: hypothetical protein EU527_03015 [Candidatus Thorarchaeota archaeon]